MPSICIQPKIACKIQKICAIDIEPDYDEAKPSFDNNRVYNFTFKHDDCRPPNADTALDDGDVVIQEKANELLIPAEPQPFEDPPATAVTSQALQIDIPRPNFSDSNSFIDAISIRTCSSSSQKSIDRLIAPQSNRITAVSLSRTNDDSDSMQMRKPTLDMDYSRPNVVQDFIREVLQSEGYVSPKLRSPAMQSIFPDTANLTSPKAVLQQTIDRIRNDRTSLDVRVLNHSNKKSAELIDNRARDALSTPKTPTTDREIQCNLVPPLNIPISQPITDRSENLAEATGHQNQFITFNRTLKTNHHRQFGDTTDTSSTTNGILPCHATFRSSSCQRDRTLFTPPSPKLYSSLKNSPKFARTINSIRNSARSLNFVVDHRSAAYKYASDREIQLAAERFLHSVEKQKRFSQQPEPRISFSSSSDSEDDAGQANEHKKCQIMNDQVIQSNFTNILVDTRMSAMNNDDNSSASVLTMSNNMTLDAVQNELLSGRLSASSDLEYSMSSIEYHISRLKLLGVKGSMTSLSQAPTHRMPYGFLDLSDGEILSEGEIRTASNDSDSF